MRATSLGFVVVLFGASLSCNAILGLSDPADEPTDDSGVDSGADVVGVDSGRDSGDASTRDSIAPGDTGDAADSGVPSDTSDTAPPIDSGTIDADAPGDTGCDATYRAAVFADSPIDFWELDETTGTTALDIGSTPHDGTYFGVAADPSLGVAGAVVCSTAAYFRGAGMLAVSGAPSFSGGVSFSVELWHRPDVVDTSKRFVIGRSTASGGWYLSSDDTGLVFVMFGSPVLSVLGPPLSSVGYTHVVATYDASGALSLYENGSLAGSKTGTTSTLPDSSASLTVAAAAGITLAPESGPFDEIALYDHALNGARVSAHYAAR